MKRRLRTPSPAIFISALALFLGAGGGAALASGLISGKQIVNHSISEKKLTAQAIENLNGARGPAGPRGSTGPQGVQGPKGDPGPQGPGAISRNIGGAPADGVERLLTTIDGIDVSYKCSGIAILYLSAHTPGDTVYVSGDYADAGDQAVRPLQISSPGFSVGAATVNLDVIAWAGSVGTISRFDLGGYYGGTCNFWGLITPGSSN